MLYPLLLTLLAHDLYLMPASFTPAPGTHLRLTYQNGDEFPAANSPVKLERLRHTALLMKQGRTDFKDLSLTPTNTVASVHIPASGIGILTSYTIPNFIELDAKEFTTYLEHENLNHIIAWRAAHNEAARPGRERYSKFVKSLIAVGASDDYYKHVAGLTIEFIPAANPYALKPGDSLPVQVLFRGKPLAAAAVESAWLESGKPVLKTIGRTDVDGRITIPIVASGPHRLHVIQMERCADPQAADWESFWASLTFAIR